MKKILLILFAILSIQFLFAQKVMKPFPWQVDYSHCIIPNHVSRDTLNNDVRNYYDKWKADYLKPTVMPGGYYVEGGTTNAKVPSKGSSEGNGYGMLITVLMAGHDSLAKEYFDGMYRFFDTHRSQLNPELMGWLIAEDERDSSFDCATDGDMDIAYSLLLADKQWGSDGEINYLEAAKRIINKGLKVSCIDHESMKIVLGDWDSLGTASRSSDWMLAEMRAYAKAADDDFWITAIDTVYSIMETIRKNYSPETGLMPDFVTGIPAHPVEDDFLEKSTDNDFSWNACRFPWRIAMDYIHYKDERAKQAMQIVVDWAKKRSEGDPAKFTSVYQLDGTPLETYTSTAFTSPLLVAAMVDESNQEFINAGWEHIKHNHYQYFNDSINLLCMLVMSGNWWVY